MFTFDALLSGGESVCVVTSLLAGAPSTALLSLTATYKDDSPGASWASDLTVSVSSWNEVVGRHGNHSEHCVHISGEAGGGGGSGDVSTDSCMWGGDWPAVMNSGISGLLYANLTVDLALSPTLEGNLGDYNTRQVGSTEEAVMGCHEMNCLMRSVALCLALDYAYTCAN